MNTTLSKDIYLYISAACNLKCNYCYISKNSHLKEVDDIIAESFKKEHYYLNLAKHYLDNDLSNVDTLEFWGAEPTLGLYRVDNTVRDFIQECPKLYHFVFSTNCTTKETVPSIKHFLDVLSEYTNRQFLISLQISVDGPAEFTDLTRGEGTTEKILKNYKELIDSQILRAYPNVECKIQLKPTLNKETLKMLETKEQNLYYYQWLEENFYDITPSENIKFYSLPNFAVPGEYTKEDGERLAQVIKIQKELEKEDKEKHYFKYYKRIALFSGDLDTDNISCKDLCVYGGFCSPAISHIGFLPNDEVCLCHRAFTNFVESYTQDESNETKDPSAIIKMAGDSKAINSFICKNYDEYKNYERRMRNFYFDPAYDKYQNPDGFTALKATIANQVMMLAAAGQILPKYKRYDEAIKVANYFVNSDYPICQHANLSISGINTCMTLGDLRMFCNGAIDLLLEKEENENDLLARTE